MHTEWAGLPRKRKCFAAKMEAINILLHRRAKFEITLEKFFLNSRLKTLLNFEHKLLEIGVVVRYIDRLCCGDPFDATGRYLSEEYTRRPSALATNEATSTTTTTSTETFSRRQLVRIVYYPERWHFKIYTY